MASEGMFVVVLTIQQGAGRLLTSPDIISRGFIYLRDSEELMGLIRQYLKQKVARSFTGKHVDIDEIKKELKDEITRILYDQTRRTPIVIPVINEVGASGSGFTKSMPQQGSIQSNQVNRQNNVVSKNHSSNHFVRPAPKTYALPQKPDNEAIEPRVAARNREY